jgi:hypothetical protein
MVDEHPTQRDGRQGDEVVAIRRARAVLVDQAHSCLVYERRRLQRVIDAARAESGRSSRLVPRALEDLIPHAAVALYE